MSSASSTKEPRVVEVKKRAARAIVKTNGSLRRRIDHRKEAVADAIDDRVHDVRRAARKAVHATEDAVDVGGILLRRHPYRTAGVAFGVGAAVALAARRFLLRRP